MGDHPRFASWASPRKDSSLRETTPSADHPSFSAKSLEDYLTCQRRYQLATLEKMKWPSAVSEPMSVYEAHLKAGQDFHRLIQRHQSGIETNALDPDDPVLAKWWRAYLDHLPADLPALRLPELQVSAQLGGYRLSARFDLFAYDEGKAVILDWKTSTYRPTRNTLSRKMQTRIYPLLASLVGKILTGYAYSPEQIALVYWFTESPASPEVFAYDEKQMGADREYLTTLMTEIASNDPATPWPLTEERKSCIYCTYRSFCDRGVSAGTVDKMEELPDGAPSLLDLDDLEEIAY